MKNVSRLASAFVLLFPLSGAAQPVNLVQNGSFTGSLSPWWQQGTGIRVQQIDGRSAVSVPSGMVVQEKIAVSGGRNYRISMDIRTDATSSGTSYAQMSFRGPSVSSAWQGPAQVSVDDRSASQCSQPPAATPRKEKAIVVTGGGPAEWRTHSVVFTAPPNANQMLLYLRKANCSSGTAAYTNVSVTETTEPATSAAELERATLAAERLPLPSPEAANQTRLEQQLGRPAPANNQHVLATAGALNMRVHVGSDADIITLQAAVDLSDFTAGVAGGEGSRQLSTDQAVSDAPLLVVGRNNAFAAKAFKESDFAGLGDDGFLIRSMGPHILIAGATPRGNMYGVNWFLDRKLGVKWLAPKETHIPRSPDISLPKQEERQVPRFSFREVLSIEADNKPWRQRNLMNGQSHGPSSLPTPTAIDSWNESWAAQGAIATFYELLPESKYRATNPEWYAGGQLAMMNKAMRAEMARVVIARLRALPDYRKVWFAIHDMDWGWDMDPASAAFAAQHGGHESAPRLDMMIEVADLVRAELPGARLAFNAYHWSFTPPEGMTVPDHILVYPMTIHVNYRDPLNGPANTELGKDIAGWNRIAKHVLVWDHITNFAGFIQPTPNIFPIGKSIQWLASLDKVDGYMGEGSFNTRGGEFAALRAWVISRLLWNPDQDIDALIAEFCDAYYGPAGPAIANYIRFYHQKISQTDDVLAEKTTVDMEMFDAEFVTKADAFFNEAESAVAGTPYLERVQAARIPVDYVILLRREEYSAKAAEIGFDVKADFAERSDRFWRAIEASGVTQYIQSDRIPSLQKLIAIERRTAPKPAIAEGMAEWKDIQDMSFQRFAGAKSGIVADNLASDGATISLDRSLTGWNTQLKFDKLPKSGDWYLYAAIRAQGASGTEKIGKLGSAPPMSCAVTISNDANFSGYRWIEVPGGPFRYSADHSESIYLQPVTGAEGKKVMIDRIVALPQPAPSVPRPVPEGPC